MFNHFKQWDNVQRATLLEHFDSGEPLLVLCEKCGRSPYAILHQLKLMKRIRHNDPRGYTYVSSNVLFALDQEVRDLHNDLTRS